MTPTVNEAAHAGDSIGARAGAAVDDAATLRGTLLVELRDEAGELTYTETVDNLIVTVGLNQIVDQLVAAPTIGKPTHMAVGTGATAPAAGQTALVTESARVALTSKTRAANVLTMVGDYAAGVGTATLNEAGVFDAATTGNMGSRALFGPQTKGANDTLKLTWTWTIS